ncbi:DinB family protein [Marinilongibacter aquaticus]|uniref:DinB family protein n=1 Tax=Marinilongibacter aquaticus TaxID=2975157 RepID=UPI0021BDE6A7|nr:DinB family protein [Marinilongibacter aquaticus]UBM57357.1 DinB family protein [Marinilongibacter aquaticus]
MEKEILLEMLRQNRETTRYAFEAVEEGNLRFRLNEDTASVGFIYRHAGETMHLLATFLGLPTDVQNTTMGFVDTGAVYGIKRSKELVNSGFEKLETLIHDTPEGEWLQKVETPFFGTVSKARILGHILFHNSHHAGQISLTLKRGR